ncbi:hypothetical protein C465_15212 [Halorubrum distributum JCM 9100]|uniref:Uncharacterized protein n=3 Tax=Halorubrum distributum TaxID=29283 RepID=M0EB09_9EURY|nr:MULTISPECIES: hypothetical protein [Halorubrum distributum group]OYR83485.1 hypothetical protein DJ84_08095 [Halorubrum ezzemoulense]PHQ45468.1 hypothetical protein DJ68_12695 [Halorubrum sp. C3]ELZ31266.1 hypothetical protein C473_11781 [Halorubrum terrestre JCM 10247]ELZ44981.1 hypothetical protein C465_15212 [Halorubrum distributum JCM 9100]ELZ51035.1 hypothetical protein C466_13979 [Halorubrum distributum JCM 10118]
MTDERDRSDGGDGAVEVEACGRCSMSTVVGAVSGDQDSEERAERDPFAGERIEVDESSFRQISPGGFLSDLKDRVDELGRRLSYGE